MSRVNLDFPNIDSTVIDVDRFYSKLPSNFIKEAIKYGALGFYGRTYRLSTQEVFIWIESHKKENPTIEQRNLQQRKGLGI